MVAPNPLRPCLQDCPGGSGGPVAPGIRSDVRPVKGSLFVILSGTPPGAPIGRRSGLGGPTVRHPCARGLPGPDDRLPLDALGMYIHKVMIPDPPFTASDTGPLTADTFTVIRHGPGDGSPRIGGEGTMSPFGYRFRTGVEARHRVEPDRPHARIHRNRGDDGASRRIPVTAFS